jgi:uncharacterized protein (TIGR02996 family)
MPVYFVYRCHEGAPNEKHVRRFEYDTVLDWAKGVWKLHDTRAEANRYAGQLFTGLDTDAFHTLFQTYEDYPMPRCPRTMADVKAWFDAFYCEETAHGAHHIQCLTEWGENQRAVYVFDDHYRAKKPGKADFLLLDGWELPGGESDERPPKMPRTHDNKPRGDAEGTLYFISTFVDCKYNLEDLSDAYRIADLRLPDLARYLLLQPDSDELSFPLNRLRDGLLEVLAKPSGEDAGFLATIRDQPADQTNWGVYSDWLADRDRPATGLHLLDLVLRSEKAAPRAKDRRPTLDLVKVTPHMAQTCKHEGRYPDSPGDELTPADWFEQYVFFDDRWAAAHPTLAAGVLAFASRWDVLS